MPAGKLSDGAHGGAGRSTTKNWQMETTEQLLARAISIAHQAHAGQNDRYGAPYILHPLRVMARVQSTSEKIVAVLHDVVEDTDWTFDQLAAEGFSPEIIQALDSVTNRPGEPYPSLSNAPLPTRSDEKSN